MSIISKLKIKYCLIAFFIVFFISTIGLYFTIRSPSFIRYLTPKIISTLEKNFPVQLVVKDQIVDIFGHILLKDVEIKYKPQVSGFKSKIKIDTLLIDYSIFSLLWGKVDISLLEIDKWQSNAVHNPILVWDSPIFDISVYVYISFGIINRPTSLCFGVFFLTDRR